MQKFIFSNSFFAKKLPNTLNYKLSNKHGFTLIEAIIVIVIIGILAAIAYVSYNGAQEKAIATSLQSDLTNASDQLRIDQANSGSDEFPDNAAFDAEISNGTIKWSNNPAYTYTVNNGADAKTFCLTATKNNQRYFITQEGTPIPGPCPVLYLDAGIFTSYPEAGSTWYDLSGKGNDGTMYICTDFDNCYEDENKIIDGALVLNGTVEGGHVTVQDPADGSLDFGTDSFSVAAWINVTAYDDYRDLVFKGAVSGYGFPGWRFGLTSSGIPHYLIEDDITSYNEHDLGTYEVSLNAWHYLTIVYNRGSSAIGYIDGVNVGTRSISTNNGSVNNDEIVKIGFGYETSEMKNFNGKIGSVFIYNSTLSDQEVKNQFNTLSSRYGL